MNILCLVNGGLNSTILYNYLNYAGNKIYARHFIGDYFCSKPKRVFDDLYLDSYGTVWTEDENLSMFRLISESLNYIKSNPELEIEAIAVGNSITDINQPPDYGFNFLSAMASPVFIASGGNVRLIHPFSELTKSEVVALTVGMQLAPEVIAHTWSCENNYEIHCGECESCTTRIEALADGGADDFTEYKVAPKQRYQSLDISKLNQSTW